jgi:hypothetical protein
MSLAMAALAVGATLYFVLNDPQTTRSVVPQEIPYTWVHVALLVVLVLLILALVGYGRQIGREE